METFKLELDFNSPLWKEHWDTVFKSTANKIKAGLDTAGRVSVTHTAEPHTGVVPLSIEIASVDNPDYQTLKDEYIPNENGDILTGMDIVSGCYQDRSMLVFTHELLGKLFGGLRKAYLDHSKEVDKTVLSILSDELIVIYKFDFIDLKANFHTGAQANIKEAVDNTDSIEESFEALIDRGLNMGAEALKTMIINNLKQEGKEQLAIPRKDWVDETFWAYESLIEDGLLEKTVTDLHIIYRLKETAES